MVSLYFCACSAETKGLMEWHWFGPGHDKIVYDQSLKEACGGMDRGKEERGKNK